MLIRFACDDTLIGQIPGEGADSAAETGWSVKLNC
jgi:hypothetical protein